MKVMRHRVCLLDGRDSLRQAPAAFGFVHCPPPDLRLAVTSRSQQQTSLGSMSPVLSAGTCAMKTKYDRGGRM